MTTGATLGSGTVNETLTTFPASLSGCQSCNWQFEIGGGPWIPQIATHTVATILLIIDNSTNITSTSTLPGSSFSTDPHQFADIVVTGTVATDDVGGVRVFLCDLYPFIFAVIAHLIEGLIRRLMRFIPISPSIRHTPNVSLLWVNCKANFYRHSHPDHPLDGKQALILVVALMDLSHVTKKTYSTPMCLQFLLFLAWITVNFPWVLVTCHFCHRSQVIVHLTAPVAFQLRSLLSLF